MFGNLLDTSFELPCMIGMIRACQKPQFRKHVQTVMKEERENEELKIDEEVFVKIPEDTVRINEDRKDLPVEAAPLTPTEVVEEMPQFPGGWYALKRYLDEHVPYPKGCIDRRIQGDVEVAFYVDQNGGVLEPKVTKSVHPELDAAALQGIKGMPQWTPGRRNGKVTIVRIRIPVHFEYQSSEFKL